MDNQTKESIIYRVVSSTHKMSVEGETYILLAPTPQQKLLANSLYSETIQKNRFQTCWMTEAQCLNMLIRNGLCGFDVDKNIKEIEKSIEDQKVKLFKSVLNAKQFAKERKTLNLVKKKYSKVLSVRHMYDHMTLKGYAEMVKRQYLIFVGLHYENGSRVWENSDEVDGLIVEQITHQLLDSSLTPEQVREIARTEPWRGLWGIKREQIFERSVFEMTEEQKSLILFSKMYDSAYEHPECPSDKIIKDDDVFDGWLIYQQREQEKSRKTKQLDGSLKQENEKLSKADEVFLVPRKDDSGNVVQKDLKEIHNMNNAEGKIIKAQRAAVVKKQGTAKDSQFLDRRVQIQQQRNQMFIQSAKGQKNG